MMDGEYNARVFPKGKISQDEYKLQQLAGIPSMNAPQTVTQSHYFMAYELLNTNIQQLMEAVEYLEKKLEIVLDKTEKPEPAKETVDKLRVPGSAVILDHMTNYASNIRHLTDRVNGIRSRLVL